MVGDGDSGGGDGDGGGAGIEDNFALAGYSRPAVIFQHGLAIKLGVTGENIQRTPVCKLTACLI